MSPNALTVKQDSLRRLHTLLLLSSYLPCVPYRMPWKMPSYTSMDDLFGSKFTISLVVSSPCDLISGRDSSATVDMVKMTDLK